MALEYNVTSKLPPAWKEQIDERVAQTAKKSVSSYIKELIAQDLGLAEEARVSTVVSEEMFEDLHAAAAVLWKSMPEETKRELGKFDADDLLGAFVQFHLERDDTLLSWERFSSPQVYNYPHEYIRR